MVMKLAYDQPTGGHLGRKKTQDRILRHFYWPNLFKEVAEYCRCCDRCQKTARVKASERAPLVPFPIIEEPFQRIAVDIVGPLERTTAGNKYILVICDYATRYPEAFPLKSIDAPHVAERLWELSSRWAFLQKSSLIKGITLCRVCYGSSIECLECNQSGPAPIIRRQMA